MRILGTAVRVSSKTQQELALALRATHSAFALPRIGSHAQALQSLRRSRLRIERNRGHEATDMPCNGTRAR